MERDVEKEGNKQVKQMGGIPYKFNSPQRRNVPDRLNAMPEGVLIFIEYKATDKEPTDGQWREINRLRELGHWVEWSNSHAMTHTIMRKVRIMIEGRR